MITIKNVKTLSGEVINHTIQSTKDYEIEAKGELLLFPGVVDPHVCLGSIESESWALGIKSLIRGGMTTIVEVLTQEHFYKKDLEKKTQLVESKLADLNISLNYFYCLTYSKDNLFEFDQLGLKKKLIKGVVIYIKDPQREELDYKWEELFQLSAYEDLPIIVNSCNENAASSKSGRESLLEKTIYYAEKWNNRLFVLNIATRKEVELIQKARKKSLLVYAETTPQHLFNVNSFESNHLWEAIHNGIIEVIGSGYDANQQNGERILFHGANFGASDPIFLLPRLLTAVHENKISIDKLVHLLTMNVQEILELSPSNDFVLIDLEKEETVTLLKEGHSTEIKLRGWPAYTIVNGHLFSPSKFGYSLNILGS